MANIVMPLQPGGSRISARFDAATRVPATHLASIPPPPKAVKIQLTAQCNFRCAYCVPRQRAAGQAEMRWPLYTRLVGEIADAGVQELGLAYMGEPYLYEWLPDAIEYAKARGIPYISVTTNGSVASPQRVKACMEAGLDALTFSVNGADEAQFADLAQAQGGLFHEALANLAAARRVRDAGHYRCGLFASSIRYDGAQQDRMQALVNRVLPYVDEHYWLPFYGSGGLVREGTAPSPCWSPFAEAHVTCEGKLSACAFRDDERWVMADLNDVSFLDGWASARFAELRDAHLRHELRGTACEGCLAFR